MKTVLSLAIGLLLVGVSGCSSVNDGSPATGPYVVKAPRTPIYRYGPAQTFGADFNLLQGQRVTMLKRDFGYSRVMTESGQSGYVATEDLAPAPPEASPSPTPKPKKPKAEAVSEPRRNALPPGEEPLGLPELPSNTPQPQFRY